MLPEIIKVILLAIVEGITEFLPVSSTGHLIILAKFIELRVSMRDTFEVFIQIGAVVAVIIFYRAELWQQARTIRNDKDTQHLWLMIIVAFIPAAAVGFLLSSKLEELFFKPLPIAMALIVGGIFFIVVERWRPTPVVEVKRAEALAKAKQITLRQAISIGLWQILALFPGMSRSGMTIMGGMVAGVDRATVTLFSFYLAIPTLGVATLYKFVKDLNKLAGDDIVYLLIGAILSGIVAYVAIGWLLRFVSRNTFIPFGIYRIILGILIIGLVIVGVL